MLHFARWKSITVLVALVLGLLFALPNLFGTDPALQLALRNYEAVSDTQQKDVEDFLRGKQVTFADSYIEDGKLMIRFGSVPEQLKARDAIAEEMTNQYVEALASAPRTPPWSCVSPRRP